MQSGQHGGMIKLTTLGFGEILLFGNDLDSCHENVYRVATAIAHTNPRL